MFQCRIIHLRLIQQDGFQDAWDGGHFQVKLQRFLSQAQNEEGGPTLLNEQDLILPWQLKERRQLSDESDGFQKHFPCSCAGPVWSFQDNCPVYLTGTVNLWKEGRNWIIQWLVPRGICILFIVQDFVKDAVRIRCITRAFAIVLQQPLSSHK